jgi:hypothetical protein
LGEGIPAPGQNYQKFKYDGEWKMVNKVHHIKNIVSRANDVDISSFIFTESIACLIDFAKLIHTKENLIHHLEQNWIKYTQQFSSEQPIQRKTIS